MKPLSLLILPLILFTLVLDAPAQKAQSKTKKSTTISASSSTKKPKSAAKPKAAARPKSAAKPQKRATGTGVATPALRKLAETQIGKLTSSQKSAMTKLLNTGSKADLLKVPGIGEKLAGAILKKRPFKSPVDVSNVNGIGERKLKSLISYIKNPKATAKATPKKK